MYLFGQRCCSCSKPKLGLHLAVRTVIFNSSGSYYSTAKRLLILFIVFLFARQTDSAGDGELAACVFCLSCWQSVSFLVGRSHRRRERRMALSAEVIGH